MDRDQIKRELITRVEPLISSYQGNSTGKLSKLKNLSQTFGNMPDFADKITDVLNQILKERNIDLEGNEKDEFIEYIKPTVNNLMGRLIKK